MLRMFLAIFLLVVSAKALAVPPQTLAELDRAVARVVGRGAPGVALAIVEGGQVTLARGYGFADVATKRPVRADTPFYAGSVSKNLTSLLALTMIRDGLIALDAPLPADLSPANSYREPIRLKHLLEHSAGIEGSSNALCQAASSTRSVSFAGRAYTKHLHMYAHGAKA